MAGETNRREFVQVAGLAASGLMAAAGSLPAAAQEARPASTTMGARFRALMNGPEPLICANAYDVLTARLIEVHGFKGVFVGSSATNAELLSLPDQAVVTVSEIIEYDIVIAANVDIPVVADVDDFGATPLNVYRFAKQAERGGIACAAFDDRMPLNRATAYSVPGVLPKAQMIDNIHAAADARTDMVLIARCLAPTPNKSYTEMLDRAAAYAEAGADMVWIGLPTAQDYVKAADMIKKPLFAVIGGPNFPATPAAMKAARVAVGQTPPIVNIALGAVDKALTSSTSWQSTARLRAAPTIAGPATRRCIWLKNAGFFRRQGDIETEGIRYDLPSLEELIEACPGNIGKATFVPRLCQSRQGVGRLLLRFCDQSRFRFQ